MMENNGRHIVRVYVGALSNDYEALSIEASKHTTASEIIQCIIQRLGFTNASNYELAEVIGNSIGQECKERRLGPFESPVAVKLLWPKDFGADALLTNGSTELGNHASSDSAFPSSNRNAQNTSVSSSTNGLEKSGSSNSCANAVAGSGDEYRFCLREKVHSDSLWSENVTMDPQVIRDYFYRFLYQPKDKEYPDLCQLAELNEETLLENLKSRFNGGHIYTYVGSILIAVNPFKFHPIYNPKYVKLYQNRRREELPPHIFAIADSAYHTMLKERRNQCIVISGESGSGKTESTNFLLHHLTALSQKGTHGSGVEQTILSAGPVLEAFGNAKTAHNNNSSRFGKFIQVSYRENGMVLGAIVQKYLLEKSRICCQAKNERNYHVFYYLLAGASETERETLNLLPPHKYHYLSQSGCYTLDGVDESYEFSRLKQSMEMVGFGPDKQKKLFCVLSAVLLLGNIQFQPKKSSYHHDESVLVKNPDILSIISSLLRVPEETLTAALTSKRAKVSGEMLVINYRLPEAIAARDAMAKCLYGAVFDWIVLQVNHALLSKKDSSGSEMSGNSIGVLDIFGFEDFGQTNSFEQFCINYANEHLQQYFNHHVFKYEQEEYKCEKIRWANIGFSDNTPCLSLIEAKPTGIICILDDQCNFPGATNETLLQKFNSVLKDHEFYEIPQKREGAFIIRHYAGKVKYQVLEFREKNMDLMRHDIVSVVKNSSLAFVRELVGIDPVAVFRWAIIRAFFRALFAFHEAGRRQRLAKAKSLNRAFSSPGRRRSSNNDHLLNADLNLSVGHHECCAHHHSYATKYKPTARRTGHHNGRPYPALNNANHCPSSNQPRVSSMPYENGYVNGNGSSEHYRTNGVPVEEHFGRHGYQNGHDHNNCYEKSNSAVANTEKLHMSPSHFAQIQSGIECDSCICCFATSIDIPGFPTPGSTPTATLKNRSFRLQPLVSARMKNLASVKTLASQTAAMGVSNKFYNARKQPISVSQQFQQSLHSLMITLNQANPFFIRCIKSNSDKGPNHFDDEIVQRQLRYTGMLETVRIRQAGYNVRLAFDEFVQLYRILLPKGIDSDREDIENFLSSLSLNHHNYQLGRTKIFLREVEKIKLDYFLHQQIMASIVSIQRWYRTSLERRHFIHIREAVIRIQSYFRMLLAQKFVSNLRIRHLAATYIQKVWRGYRVRKWYESFRETCVQFQARVRGSFARQRYQNIVEQQRKVAKETKLLSALRIKDGDSHSAQSSDEAFLSKGSSQEELNDHRHWRHRKFVLPDTGDSDESSGVHEESEGELPPVPPRQGQRYSIPQASHLPQCLADSMPALTLALTSTPFAGMQHLGGQRNGKLIASRSSSGSTSGTGSKSSASPTQRQRSVSPTPNKESQINSSQNQPGPPPPIKERTKKKLSLKGFKNSKDQEEEEEYAGKEDPYENILSKNPFHRAKKHIKTFISGSKTKLEKHEAVLLDSESETEDTDTLTCKSSSSSQTLDRAPSLPSDAQALAHNFQQLNLNTQSRLSLDSKLNPDRSELHVRQTKSVQLPLYQPSASPIPEVDFGKVTSDRAADLTASRSQEEEDPGFEDRIVPPARFHRKIKREDTGAFGVIAKARAAKRDDRPKLFSMGTSSDSRRASDDLLEDADSDVRRDSGDSNKSNPSVGESPSNSSQDSLFELNRTGGLQSPLVLTQSRSYGFAPAGIGSALIGSTAHNKRGLRPSHDLDDTETSSRSGLSTPDFLSSRDVRRTKSVSDSRRGYVDNALMEVSSEEILEPLSKLVSVSSSSSSVSPPGKKSGYHVLDKVTKFHRGDICCGCRKNMHVLFAPGYRCYLCHLFFHTKCVQNGAVYNKLCRVGGEVLGSSTAAGFAGPIDTETPENAARSSNGAAGRKKYRKGSKNQMDMTKPGKFNLTGTSEFTDRTDQIISGVKELQLMQEFISKKIYQVRNKDGEKENAVDRVFTQALREFKESLVSTFSVASKSGNGAMLLNIKYKDLIANFANIMETVCKHEGTGNDFPTTMGVNAFRGFLNEFMNAHRIDEKPKGGNKAGRNTKERRKESKRNKRGKADEVIMHLGHSFVSMVINIPTACEICSSFIMWPLERGVVCQKCKLACHKKCHLKIMQECHEGQGRSNSSAGNEGAVFGAPLRLLAGPDNGIPILVEQLVTAIEFYGLRMEGLYRKSGVSSKVRELKQEIEDGKDISWDAYPVHVLTSVLKAFFREMPEPLLSFELYDEFVRAADLSQPEDRVHTIFAILKKLPKINYDLLERLVFHLVRVALYEDKNRMNANSLAIVFAPCILRTNKTRQVQESLSDISRQTTCIETILAEQLKKVKATLSNIESVDSATHSFSVRLNSIRSSKIRSPPERKKPSTGSTGSLSEGSNEKSMNESTTPESMSAEEEEEYLTRHLQHLQDEKAMLTSVLPSLSRTPSDDDMLSTDPEVDSPGGSVDDLNLHHHLHGRRSPSPRKTRAQSLQYSKSDALFVDSFNVSRLSPTLRLPATSPLLQNLVKHRGPMRKPPSRFVRNLAVVDFGEGEGEEESFEVDGDDDEEESGPSIDQANEDEEEPIMV